MEQISVFDIFKIGVGPSSSHTMGPWVSALRFLNKVKGLDIEFIEINLYGSLSKTGKGHGTDIAIMLGLEGYNPKEIATEKINEYIQKIKEEKKLKLNKAQKIEFDLSQNIHFLRENLPYHPNALTFVAKTKEKKEIKETYYSIGGGFVLSESETESESENKEITFPYPIHNEESLKFWLNKTGLSISEVVLKNELSLNSNETTLKDNILAIWNIMLECTHKGCHTTGILPGGLSVQRRAFEINQNLLKNQKQNSISEWLDKIKESSSSFDIVTRWVSCFALAVNEENASFGRVVTAPTNGAAGVIPAVIMYLLCFCKNQGDNDIIKFLLTASQIGAVFKQGSTISAAMGGCQAEIGVSSSMAAAGLTECLGGTPLQVLMAAEIAMEHHLGLTCDPIKGLVQIPCIERNVMGAMKAITAAHLALSGNPSYAKVSLDGIIKTMKETARDMSEKYKETSEGGLAVNIPVNVAEC